MEHSGSLRGEQLPRDNLHPGPSAPTATPRAVLMLAPV